MPLPQVPRAQKSIVRHARARKVPVILATQVLESMTLEPRPTRAEVSDAAHAVEDGVDAIMLSGETASGASRPVVKMLDAIIREAKTDSTRAGCTPAAVARARPYAGDLRSGGYLCRARPCRRHRRGHARWKHQRASFVATSDGADHCDDRSRRPGSPSVSLLGRRAGMHRHRRRRRAELIAQQLLSRGFGNRRHRGARERQHRSDA